MWDVSGVTGAAPIWLKSSITCTSSNPAARRVCLQASCSAKSCSRPRSSRAVVSGLSTEPSERRVDHKRHDDQHADLRAAARILSPADGTVIAPDPDIPASRQSMLVRVDAPQATRVCLKLAGLPLARCGVREVLIALPPPGKHQIRMESADGVLLAQASVEVRGVPR